MHTLCTQDVNQLNTHIQFSTLKTEHPAERNLGKLVKYHLVLTEINVGVVKVKFTLEQAMKGQRGSTGIALLFL